jgi:NADH:ubiquinone oxidoreductase subunit F (NADH-binding)
MEETKLVLRNVGKIDPVSSQDYVAHGGYVALARATQAPDLVIGQISEAGLRGRGGASFPVGLKWNMVKTGAIGQKYVVCNADEGEPGSEKDRVLLSGDPHALIEGMAICGTAVGADMGFIYLRAEYASLRDTLRKAIDDARAKGFLGARMLGSPLAFDIELRLGAGAYVCGEETGLLESIEGRRGEPRLKPPFPGRAGLWARPTVINNVETFVNVPIIMNLGAAGYRRYGTKKSPGTKLFCVNGNVSRPGVYEFPMGVSVRELYEIAGGYADGKRLKAIQTGGGASGSFIRPELMDLAMDVESCAAAGAVFGTGSLVFIDEESCIVDLCSNCMEFFCDESCGKCVPCRLGIRRMLETLARIASGHGSEDDLGELEKLATYINRNSLCALGQMAPTAVASALRNFRDEFEAHVDDKTCPAGVCGIGAA